MSSRKPSLMELTPVFAVDIKNSQRETIHHELWPLGEIDPKNSKFPCCLVWTSLPVVSWLAPFIGHVGICREDGVILDFSGSNLISLDSFAFGSVARYLQLEREKCCFPPNLAAHTCKHSYKHAELGSSMTWDDALNSSTCQYEHKSYNIFTCNCHSFAADCLNRLCYEGSMNWNMISVAVLMLRKGRWVNGVSVIRAFMPFIVVLFLGVYMAGWLFLIALVSFSLMLIGWFILRTLVFKDMLEG